MALQTTFEGAITGWTNNPNLISGSTEAQSCTVNCTADEADATVFVETGINAASYALGLRSWTVDIPTVLTPATYGLTGGIANFTNGYAPHVQSWTLNMAWDVDETTVMNTDFSALAAKSYTPGLLRWGGTFVTLVDDSTALVLPGPGTSTASVDFNIVDNGAGTDWKMEGTVFAQQVGIPIEVGKGRIATTYTFRGSGDLTFTGTGGTYDSPWFTSGSAIAVPTAGTLTVQMGELAGGALVRTLSGTAFPSAMTIVNTPNDLIRANITAQGSGDLTVTYAS